jgi:hypothetical protein
MSMMDGDLVNPAAVESCADACCGSALAAPSLTPEREALIKAAFRLEWMTVAWMVIKGIAPTLPRASSAAGCRSSTG